MVSIITHVGKKQIELRPYKNYTIPLMPSSYHVDLLNITQKMGYIPPIELIQKEPNVNSNPASICQYEKSLLKEGLLVGDRRKGTLKISENSYTDKPVAGILLTLSDFEQRGEKTYIHSTYSESEIADLTARLKEETGIEQERMDLQIDILRRKGYIREDGRYLVINQEKWVREKLVVKEISERGLEKYDLPSRFILSKYPGMNILGEKLFDGPTNPTLAHYMRILNPTDKLGYGYVTGEGAIAALSSKLFKGTDELKVLSFLEKNSREFFTKAWNVNLIIKVENKTHLFIEILYNITKNRAKVRCIGFILEDDNLAKFFIGIKVSISRNLLPVLDSLRSIKGILNVEYTS